VYERECVGSNTAPLVSPTQSIVGFCENVYGFADGRRLGALPVFAEHLYANRLAAVPSLRGLVIEHELRLSDGTVAHVDSTDGEAKRLAFSPDKKRVLAVVERPHGLRVELHELGGRAPVRSAPLEVGNDETRLGFQADGTPLVLAERGCSTAKVACPDGGNLACEQTTCARRGLFRLDDGRLSDVLPALDDALGIVFSSRGRRALVAREDGARTYVDLGTGATLASLPSLPDDFDAGSFGIDDTGDRIAYLASGKLVIAAWNDGALTVLHTRPFHRAEALVFSPDGHTLFIKAQEGMLTLREGAPERAQPQVGYRVTLPRGFHSVWERAAPIGVDQPLPNETHETTLLPPGLLARYGSDEGFEVRVRVLDPREVGPADAPLETWALVARSRDWHADSIAAANVRTWRTSDGRATEYARFIRDGCDPTDLYVRVSEKGGVLYRIELEVPAATPRKRVRPVLERFFDAALGPPDARGALAVPPRVPRGPC
jgi:hypothetical protein